MFLNLLDFTVTVAGTDKILQKQGSNCNKPGIGMMYLPQSLIFHNHIVVADALILSK